MLISLRFGHPPGRVGLLCAAVAVALGTVASAPGAPASEEPPMRGPTIRMDALKPGTPFRIIGYGDTRFTDPSNSVDTNPRMRKFLVEQIAKEAPDAIFETGDLPLVGSNPADWDNFRSETASWRKAGLRIFPAIGNHEVMHDLNEGVHHYLAAFPQLAGCRYYSAELGNVYLIAIDEFTPMASGTRQHAWVVSQIEHLPPEIDFIFFLDHMPLVADLQSEVAVGLPGPHETALRKLLESEKPKTRAHFVVLSGHIHNYERFERPGISYITTGGGGAKPYPIFVRGPEDLYRDTRFPVFNYVVFAVRGRHIDATMYRVAEPKAVSPAMEIGERFMLDAPER